MSQKRRQPRTKSAVAARPKTSPESVAELPVRVQDQPEVLAGPRPRAVAQLSGDAEVVFNGLARSHRQLRQLEDQLADDVAAARGYGVSWATIGWAVGLSGEACRQRWARRLT